MEVVAHYLQEHYGDVASVVGLLITLIGFSLTLYNVRRTKRAVEEARQATREAIERIASQLLMSDVSASLRLVGEIDRACGDRAWPNASYRCDEARLIMARLVENPRLEANEREIIDVAARNLGLILIEIQRLRASSEQRDLKPRMKSLLHALVVTLGRIESRLQSQAFKV